MDSLKERALKDLLVVHCSGTCPQTDIDADELRRRCAQRGYLVVDHHYIIRRDGSIQSVVPESASVGGQDSSERRTINLCLIGGADRDGQPQANFSRAQYDALRALLAILKRRYSDAGIIGHRDLAPTVPCNEHTGPGACPSFDVQRWWSALHEQVCQPGRREH